MSKEDIPVLVLYHNDGDGKCAAAIVDHFELGCKLQSINYGYDTPWNLIKRSRKVYMVDYGLQPFSDMIKLKNMKGDNFIWIDHHKTAIEDMVKSGQKFKGIQEIGKAGCELTWEYFSKEPKPKIVTMLGRYDVWDLTYHEDILPIQTGMMFRDALPEDRSLWQSLLLGDNVLYHAILETGRTCLSYQTMLNTNYCKSHTFDLEWEGLRFLAANAMNTNSQLFTSKYNELDYDAVLTFGWTNNKWTISMYTNCKEGVDVGAIAKKYGGGGHQGAAGAQFKELPFTLPYNN